MTNRVGYPCVKLFDVTGNQSSYPKVSAQLQGKLQGTTAYITASTANALDKIQDANVLIKQKYLRLGASNQALSIYATKGLVNEIAFKFLQDGPSQDGEIANLAMKYDTDTCGGYASVEFCELQQQIVDRPLMIASDTHRDHVYLLAGDFRCPTWAENNTAVGDAFQIFPIASTLAEADGYQPSSADVIVSYYSNTLSGVTNYDPLDYRDGFIPADCTAFDPDGVVKERPSLEVKNTLTSILESEGTWHAMTGVRGNTTYVTPDTSTHRYDDIPQDSLNTTEQCLNDMERDGFDQAYLDEISKRPHLKPDEMEEDDDDDDDM